MKQVRCEICGGFYDPNGPCPKNHPTPPPPPPKAGAIVVYDWPDHGPVWGVICSQPDEDGSVAFAPFQSNVRVPLDDLKEI